MTLGMGGMVGGGGGMGGGRGIGKLLELPSEFRWLLIFAGAFVVMSMGIGRLSSGHGGHEPPRWTKRFGAEAGFVASVLGIIATWGAIAYSIVQDIEPEIGGILLAAVAILPGINAISGLLECGRKRAWVWVIQRGEHIHIRLTQCYLGAIALIVVLVVIHAMTDSF